MEWLNNLVSSWTSKSEEEKFAESQENIANSGRKIISHFKSMASDYNDINDDDIKSAAADFLGTINIHIGKKPAKTTN